MVQAVYVKLKSIVTAIYQNKSTLVWAMRTIILEALDFLSHHLISPGIYGRGLLIDGYHQNFQSTFVYLIVTWRDCKTVIHLLQFPINMVLPLCSFNSSPHGQNGHHCGRRQLQMQLFEWKWQNSYSNFTSQLAIASIGSGNGLAPNRRQTITRTNAYPVHRRIHAALGGDNLDRLHNVVL